MTGAAVEAIYDDKQLQELVHKVALRAQSWEAPLAIIGEVVRTSVVRNFEEGGRPEPWAELSDATLLTKRGGKVMVDQGFAGGLMGSIHSKIEGADTVLVGTDKVYGAIHQFGGEAGPKTKRVQIPARPYLMVQDEDWVEIIETLQDYLLG